MKLKRKKINKFNLITFLRDNSEELVSNTYAVFYIQIIKKTNYNVNQRKTELAEIMYLSRHNTHNK